MGTIFLNTKHEAVNTTRLSQLPAPESGQAKVDDELAGRGQRLLAVFIDSCIGTIYIFPLA